MAKTHRMFCHCRTHDEQYIWLVAHTDNERDAREAMLAYSGVAAVFIAMTAEDYTAARKSKAGMSNTFKWNNPLSSKFSVNRR
jgi:hypothetical protein